MRTAISPSTTPPTNHMMPPSSEEASIDTLRLELKNPNLGSGSVSIPIYDTEDSFQATDNENEPSNPSTVPPSSPKASSQTASDAHGCGIIPSYMQFPLYTFTGRPLPASTLTPAEINAIQSKGWGNGLGFGRLMLAFRLAMDAAAVDPRASAAVGIIGHLVHGLGYWTLLATAGLLKEKINNAHSTAFKARSEKSYKSGHQQFESAATAYRYHLGLASFYECTQKLKALAYGDPSSSTETNLPPLSDQDRKALLNFQKTLIDEFNIEPSIVKSVNSMAQQTLSQKIESLRGIAEKILTEQMNPHADAQKERQVAFAAYRDNGSQLQERQWIQYREMTGVMLSACGGLDAALAASGIDLSDRKAFFALISVLGAALTGVQQFQIGHNVMQSASLAKTVAEQSEHDMHAALARAQGLLRTLDDVPGEHPTIKNTDLILLLAALSHHIGDAATATISMADKKYTLGKTLKIGATLANLSTVLSLLIKGLADKDNEGANAVALTFSMLATIAGVCLSMFYGRWIFEDFAKTIETAAAKNKEQTTAAEAQKNKIKRGDSDLFDDKSIELMNENPQHAVYLLARALMDATPLQRVALESWLSGTVDPDLTNHFGVPRGELTRLSAQAQELAEQRQAVDAMPNPLAPADQKQALITALKNQQDTLGLDNPVGRLSTPEGIGAIDAKELPKFITHQVIARCIEEVKLAHGGLSQADRLLVERAIKDIDGSIDSLTMRLYINHPHSGAKLFLLKMAKANKDSSLLNRLLPEKTLANLGRSIELPQPEYSPSAGESHMQLPTQLVNSIKKVVTETGDTGLTDIFEQRREAWIAATAATIKELAPQYPDQSNASRQALASASATLMLQRIGTELTETMIFVPIKVALHRQIPEWGTYFTEEAQRAEKTQATKKYEHDFGSLVTDLGHYLTNTKGHALSPGYDNPDELVMSQKQPPQSEASEIEMAESKNIKQGGGILV
jgi:hypothetical protein